MTETSKLTGVEIVAFALPRIQLGVTKVRIAAELGITRQALDYHLDKSKGPRTTNAKAAIDAPEERTNQLNDTCSSTTETKEEK